MLPILHLRGLSTGNSQEALKALLGEEATGLSPANISKLPSVWVDDYQRFRTRDLSDRDYVYIWADGVHFNIRLEEDRLCTLVILGAHPDGMKELIALEDGLRESAESWATLLRDLGRRAELISLTLSAGRWPVERWLCASHAERVAARAVADSPSRRSETQPMGFDQHLFISYAHIDNQPLAPEQKGWISRFHDSLETMLGMRLGRQASIWRDEKLTGSDIFDEAIVRQFPRTALFMSILTPRYVGSEWCTREVVEFCRAAEHNGGLVVENKSRIVKIIKTPLDNDGEMPAIMRRALGYPFYTLDGETPLELDPAYGAEHAQKYNLKLAKLAYELAQLIKKLENGNGRGRSEPNGAAVRNGQGSARSVYLAECSYDRREVRELLEAELRLHGYTVYPDAWMPADEKEYTAAVERFLERCELSIHLIGSARGAVPDGPGNRSAVELQHELAIHRARTGSLKRVIWLPAATVSQQREHQQFIGALHNDADAQFGADLITGDVETLKGAVHAALAPNTKKSKSPFNEGGASGAPLIYLICEKRDRTDTLPLRKYLREQGFEVEIPIFEGNAAAVRQANHELLDECNAVLIWYGAGDEFWRRTVVNDVRKQRNSRSERPLHFSYTYLAGPLTDDKDELLKLEDSMIDGLVGFSETALRPFLNAVRS